MKWFYYLDELECPIRIKAPQKPRLNRMPRSGTLIVHEFNSESKQWSIGCFPEVTWGVLKDLRYIGKTEVESQYLRTLTPSKK